MASRVAGKGGSTLFLMVSGKGGNIHKTRHKSQQPTVLSDVMSVCF